MKNPPLEAEQGTAAMELVEQQVAEVPLVPATDSTIDGNGSGPESFRLPKESAASEDSVQRITADDTDAATQGSSVVADARNPPPTSSPFDEDDGLCVVCFENPMGTRLEPCGHSYFCQECAGEDGVHL